MNNNNEMHQQNDITVNHFTFKQVTSYVIIEYSLAMAQKRKILREWIIKFEHFLCEIYYITHNVQVRYSATKLLFFSLYKCKLFENKTLKLTTFF